MSEATHLTLTQRLGLDDGGADAFRDMVSGLGGTAGRDLSQIMDRLGSGQGLRAALDLPPETVDILYAQAFGRFNAGQLGEAEALFRGLCLLAPETVDHWLGFGICQRMAERFEAARMAFDIALDLPGDAAVVRFHRAELACREGQWREAATEAQAYHAAPDTQRKQALGAEMMRIDALLAERGTGPRR
jgi:predicted Zn-dependent protease